jgi:hypothetical protein
MIELPWGLPLSKGRIIGDMSAAARNFSPSRAVWIPVDVKKIAGPLDKLEN